VTGSENDPYVFTLADFGFTDPLDGDDLAAVLFQTLPAKGTLYTDADGIGVGAPPVAIVAGNGVGRTTVASGHLYFQPAQDESGSPYASFTFRLRDNGGTTNGGINTSSGNTLTINLAPDNRPPVADDDAAATDEDTPVTVTKATMLAGDNDADNDPLAITGIANVTNGTTVFNALTGAVAFTPTANFHGTAGYDYTLSDGKGGTDTGHVTITVASVNDLPVADDEAATTSEDLRLDIPLATLLAGNVDADNDPLSVSAVFSATGGTVAIVGTVARFTPTPDYNGPGGFDYTVSDGQGGSGTGHVSLTITPMNDLPIAVDDLFSTAINAPIRLAPLALLGNDRDIDGDQLELATFGGAVGGEVFLDREGVINFAPDAGFRGTGGFDYVVSDQHGGHGTGHVTVEVGLANRAPVVTPGSQALATLAGMPLALRVAASDPDGDALSWLAGTPGHGTLGGGSLGAFTYTPAAGFTGRDSFSVAVSDGHGHSVSQTVVVSVLPSAAGASGFRMMAPNGFAGAIGGSGVVYGDNGPQDITLLATPGAIAFDPSFNRGGDTIHLPGAAADFTVVRSGSNALFLDADAAYTIPVGTAGLRVAFDDGARTLLFDGSQVRIGSQAVTATAAQVTAPSEAGGGPTGVDPAAVARLFMAHNSEVAINGDFAVFGTNVAQTVAWRGGDITFDPSFNAGADRVVLPGAATAYTAEINGSTAVLDHALGSLAIPVGTSGVVLDFSGPDDRVLRYDIGLGQVLIGSQAIPLDPIALAAS